MEPQKDRKKTYTIVMIIGSLGVLAGLYALITNDKLWDSFYAFFIGFTLIGTAYFNLRKDSSKKE